MPVPKIDVWGIFPTQFLSQNTNFKSELKNVNKHGILKFTLLLIKLEHKVFQNSMVLTKAIYIRLVDMKCPLVVVILIYTHLMQVC